MSPVVLPPGGGFSGLAPVTAFDVLILIGVGVAAGMLIVGGAFVAAAANPPQHCWRQFSLGLGMIVAGMALAVIL